MSDADRPLAPRGIRQALDVGEWLASRGYLPEEVLCSSALRTAETWATLHRTPLEVMPKLRMLPELYHAPAERMLELLQRAMADCVLMLGHNPGISEFAALLPAEPPADPAFRRYPTAATLVVDFQIPRWSDLRAGTGTVQDFYVPAKD